MSEVKQQKVGVVLARFQPIHDGHLHLIRRAAMDNDKVLVIIGSSDKSGTIRNPLDANQWRMLIRSAIEIEPEIRKKVLITDLPDWSDESDLADGEWGQYLYYFIVSKMKTKTFSMYYSDQPEIIKSWFSPEILDRIDLALLDREMISDGVSATKIRSAIKKGNDDFVKRYCPKVVHDYRSMIAGMIAKAELADKSAE